MSHEITYTGPLILCIIIKYIYIYIKYINNIFTISFRSFTNKQIWRDERLNQFLLSLHTMLLLPPTPFKVNPSFEFTKISLLSETYWRSIGDLSETHRRPTCLIGDQSKTDMPDWRPPGDQLASSDTHRRSTCLIGD